MIDEKKLIHDLIHDDGIYFRMKFVKGTEDEILHSLNEFKDKMKEGFANLINRQPRVSCGGWIRTADELPGMFVSVLMYIPGDHPLPVVHEGYLNKENIWFSLFHEASYTMDEVPFWMPMPEPPKDGEADG